MLGLVVDLDLRVIRSDMAFAAGIGRAGLGLGKAVTAMAGGTGAGGTVGIDTANPRVRPGARRRPAVFADFDLGTMALLAAGIDCRGTTNHLAEQVVERGQYLPAFRVVRAVHLLEFRVVTPGTVLRCDNDGNALFLVHEAVDVTLFRLVAVETVDACLTMLAVVPLLCQARILRPVAVDALLAGRVAPVLSDFPRRAGGKHATRGQQQDQHQC